MDTVDNDVLVSLSSHSGWPSVSLYLPTHRSGSEKEQDRIRLKNLSRATCERLSAEGMRVPDAERFCAPLTQALADDTFWRETGDGLVAFLSASHTWMLKLDVSVTERAVVGDRFYVRPLLAVQRGGRHFFALALSKNGCRLYRGDGACIEQVALDGAPASLAEELKYDVGEESLQLTSFAGPQAASGTGGRVGMFHGHGGEKDAEKIGLERYLRKVDQAVTEHVACDSDVPLLLMGVDYEVSTYRSISTCAALVPEQVLGSPDRLAIHQVYAAALDALASRFEESVRSELTELTEKEGSPLASHDPATILAASASGRVKSIFLDDSTGPFGTFDRDTFAVADIFAEEPDCLRERGSSHASGECGWDLVDLAAAETILHGGVVHAFAGEDAPVHGAAAIFRY